MVIEFTLNYLSNCFFSQKGNDCFLAIFIANHYHINMSLRNNVPHFSISFKLLLCFFVLFFFWGGGMFDRIVLLAEEIR